MSVGLGLLHRIITGKESLGVLDEKGLGKATFVGDEIKVYNFIRRHFIRYGSMPSLTTVTAETRVAFPSFPEEPVEYWVERVQERTHSGLMMDVAEKLKKAIANGDVEEARGLIRNVYFQVSTTDVNAMVEQLADVAERVLELHDRLQLSSTMSGVPFGIPYLDSISGGAQPADSVAIVGTKSVGKTFFILSMCLVCYAMGGMPLLVTLEMSTLQIVRRMLALRNHVMGMMIRLGMLSHWARKRLADDLENLKRENKPFPILQGTLKTTIDDIAVKVKEIRPTALYVDGAYLLRVGGKNLGRVERVTEAAEFLKTIAKDANIPTIGTYQFARRKRGTGMQGIENIGWSDAIGQLASIVLALRDIEGEEGSGEGSRGFGRNAEHKILEILKGREGERGKVRILFDMSRMSIEQEEVLDGYDLSEGGTENGE